MRISARLTGTAELKATLNRLSDSFSASALEAATRSGALLIENRAKELAPVRTGNLRRSIHSETEVSTPTRCTILIGTNVYYAPFQEYGTRFMRAHSFLRPALDEQGPAAQREVAAAFRDILRAL